MCKTNVVVPVATVLLTVAIATTGLAASGSFGNGNGVCKGNGKGEKNCIYDGLGSSAVVSSLTPVEEGYILFMREEEKLARDVYDALFLSYENLVFDNISDSEQRHMDAMGKLVNKYGLTDPVLEPGVFTNPELQDLYDTLMLFAHDEPTALVVGAMIEETDIVDLRHAIAVTDSDHINSTYESLMCGSSNHLRAFVGQLEAIYVEYVPLGEDQGGLAAEEFWEIAHSDMQHNCSERSGNQKGNSKNH